MDAAHTFFSKVFFLQSIATDESTYFTHFLPLYFLPPPSPSENGCFGMYHIGQNRYHDST